MPVSLATFAGAPDGMVRGVPQHELPDTAAWTILDAFLNQPGIIRRRAGLYTDIDSLTDAYAIGLAGTVAPDNTWVGVELVRLTTGPAGSIHGFKNSTMAVTWPVTPNISPHSLFDSKPALKGGAFIGAATDLGAAPSASTIVYWRGAAKALTSTTTTGAVARGATSFTLTAGGTNVSPGHWVFNDSNILVGVVKSVSGNTVTLEKPALQVITANVTFQPFRKILPRVSKGRITCSSASTTVNGGLTQFRKLDVDSGTWDLFTTDYVYIGTVSSVTADAQLELGSNAAVSLLNSDYLAIKRIDGTALSGSPVGFLNATHGGHQFFAQGNGLFFSDDDDPEALDLIDDNLVFSDDPISALVSCEAGLLIATENEAFALVGVAGTTPDRWAGAPVHDDGALFPMTAQEHEGGAIWAGRRGVWYWNGAKPVNMLASWGDTWEKITGSLSANTRMWSMVANDHYFLHVEGTSQTEIKYQEPGSAVSLQNLARFTLVINMKTGAISLLRNVGIRGATRPPTSVGAGESYFAVTTDSGSTKLAKVFTARSLFRENSSQGRDAYNCLGESGFANAGPFFNLETKKYDLGNPQILKLFKLFLLHFYLEGTQNTQELIDAETADHLRFATFKGMNRSSTLSGKKLFLNPTTAIWLDKRVKFMARSQFCSILCFPGTSTITDLQLGAWAIGYKSKRAGRV